MSFGNETDQKIISILKYGKRQQSEIIGLIDRNESTVRRHLDYLEEKFGLCRERKGNQVFYYLDENERNIVPPKPYVDAKEVSNVLYEIHSGLDLSDSPSNLSPDELLENILDLNRLAAQRYYVVDIRENLDIFLDIFDYIIDYLCKKESFDVMIPDDVCYFTISVANNLYSNWEKGKENEDYHKCLSERTDHIHSTIGNSSKNVERSAQTLLFSISNIEGQKAFISMAKSGKYDSNELLNGPIYAYNQKNDLDKLLDELDNIEDELGEKDHIQNIITNIKHRFVRSFENI